MSGVVFTTDINDAELRAFLEQKIARMKDLRPFHANVGEHLLNSVEDRFDSETAPDGSAWKALSPVTVALRQKRHGNAELTILREWGHLAGSFNYRASHEHVQVGSPVVYAAIHHFGGNAGRGHSVEIPARPILGLSAEDEAVIQEIAEDFLEG